MGTENSGGLRQKRREVPGWQARSQRTQLTLSAGTAHSIDVHSMPPVLKPLLVRKDREHPLETFVGELHHLAALLADQVLVVGLSGPGLEAPEAFTELMSPDQSALDQKVEGPVHGGQADPLTALIELAPNALYREMIVRMKDDLRHQIPLAGDRLMGLPKGTAEPFEKGRCVRPIQTSHGAQRRGRRWRRTRTREQLAQADARRPVGL